MATIKQRMWRKNASGTYDTIHLETESGLVLRPSGRTVEQDLTDYLPKTQDSDTPPETLNFGQLSIGNNKVFAGFQGNRVGEIGGTESVTQSVTLSQSAWTTSGDRVRQVVTVNGITASTPVIVVDVSLTGSDLEADATVLDAWLNGPSNQNIEQGTNQLIFYSISTPTVNIPIQIGVC